MDRSQYAGSAWDELKHIRQAIEFLVYIFMRNNAEFIC